MEILIGTFLSSAIWALVHTVTVLKLRKEIDNGIDHLDYIMGEFKEEHNFHTKDLVVNLELFEWLNKHIRKDNMLVIRKRYSEEALSMLHDNIKTLRKLIGERAAIDHDNQEEVNEIINNLKNNLNK